MAFRFNGAGTTAKENSSIFIEVALSLKTDIYFFIPQG